MQRSEVQMECSHYTSLNGILNILEKRTLRFTNILFLNDQNEYSDALHHIKRLLVDDGDTEKAAIWPNLSEYKKIITDSLKDLEQGYRELNFTASFSKEQDLLSQWRGYCPQNNGYGIIFDTDMIADSAGKIFRYVYHRDCIYSNDTKLKEIKKILNTYYKYYDKLVDDFIPQKIFDFLFEVDQMACFMKDSSFSEEKEVRVVVSILNEQDNIKFRAGDGTLIPFLEIPFSQRAIKKIIIGPTIDQERAEKALSQFLSVKCKGCKPRILHSSIPFRSW